MKTIQNNPFSVVKASDYTDEQINEYWVDIPGGEGFSEIAKPLSEMPMIILGGKGSGKTHLMRYFSYTLQRIRHGESYIEKINEDKYVGIYFRCGGLNSERFGDKGFSKDVWKTIFAYYFDVWISQLVVEFAINYVELSNTSVKVENTICKEILNCFDVSPVASSDELTLTDIHQILIEQQKDIDSKVNNSIFSKELDVNILSTQGRLVFGIPKILESHIEGLKNILFVYLIDELENFSSEQQKYIQTLLRERQHPCSIKIGVRSYGIKTYETYADGEENREGNEFEAIKLDDELRAKNKDFDKFARELCVSRLKASGLNDFSEDEKSIDKYFEDPKSIDEFGDINRITSGINGKTISSLQKKLKNNVNQESLDKILSLLSFEGVPIIEVAAVYAFYKSWSRNKDLVKSAEEINDSYNSYLKNKNNKKIKEIISHYKKDFIAQLRYVNKNQAQVYAGIKNIIDISRGFPRHYLTILKHIYQASIFNGENPFTSGEISIRSQSEGVQQSSQWFYDEARIAGEDGTVLKNAINKLAELFRINRYSDKPTECSLRAFYTDMSKLDNETVRLIKLAHDWSLLIKDNKGRPDKNSGRIDDKYILNAMLSPHWGLPIGLRGVIHLDSNMLKSIFNPTHENEHQNLKADFLNSRNAPFIKGNKKKQGEFSLGLL